jgi:hypothetical protein
MLALLPLLLALSSAPAGEETKLGTGVSLKDATSIQSLLATPEDFVGKTVRIDGVATAVCTHMGCWMAVAPKDNPASATVRLKVDDGVIVFPVSAKGKPVSAEGVFERVGSTPENQEAAGEHAKHDAKASKTYQIKASGAVIKN